MSVNITVDHRHFYEWIRCEDDVVVMEADIAAHRVKDSGERNDDGSIVWFYKVPVNVAAHCAKHGLPAEDDVETPITVPEAQIQTLFANYDAHGKPRTRANIVAWHVQENVLHHVTESSDVVAVMAQDDFDQNRDAYGAMYREFLEKQVETDAKSTPTGRRMYGDAEVARMVASYVADKSDVVMAVQAIFGVTAVAKVRQETPKAVAPAAPLLPALDVGKRVPSSRIPVHHSRGVITKADVGESASAVSHDASGRKTGREV